MMAVDPALHCPTCSTQFARNDHAFPLHVSTCTPPGIIDAEYKQCLICFKAFGPNVPANEIMFHKDECERVNGPPPRRSVAQKRRRGSDADKPPLAVSTSYATPAPSRAAHSTAPPEAPLDSPTGDSTPSLCYICGQGGRQLIVCTATCSRAFHVGCLGENNVLTQRQGLSARKVWQCAECSRSVHTCFACGFLGDDGVDIFPCSVAGCGLYCHDRCMADRPAAAATYVCGRHTCQDCHLPIATPFTDCIKCYKCATAVHKTCHVKSQFQPKLTNLVGGFGDCGRHPAAPVPAHFKAKIANHDVVLVLEFANNVLSVTAQTFKGNQWGRVVRTEQLDGGAQLLSVLLFSCGTVISVPGHYVLRTGNHYTSTPACLSECMTGHVHAEWNIRRTMARGQPLTLAQQEDAMMDTCLAFQDFGKQLKLTSKQLIENTRNANKSWTETAQPHCFLDTRRRRPKAAT